jgi:hypothetical protein
MVVPVSEPAASPLARLVIFIICLSIAATFVAGAHYYVVDLPEQKAMAPPMNFNPDDPGACAKCLAMCGLTIWDSDCPNNCMRCECSPYECSDR